MSREAILQAHSEQGGGGMVREAPERLGCALVSGASRGIGAACARRLAQSGWVVGVNFRANEALARETVAEIEREGGCALALAGDVCEQGAVEEMFARMEAACGPVLVLVNNAGVTDDALAVQLHDPEWERVIETNLGGAFRMTRRALRSMLRARFGRIVNIASLSAIRGVPGRPTMRPRRLG